MENESETEGTHANDEHDREHCLWCRMIDVIVELYPGGPTPKLANDTILPFASNIAGRVLVQMNNDDLFMFFQSVLEARDYERAKAMAEMVGNLAESLGSVKH